MRRLYLSSIVFCIAIVSIYIYIFNATASDFSKNDKLLYSYVKYPNYRGMIFSNYPREEVELFVTVNPKLKNMTA